MVLRVRCRVSDQGISMHSWQFESFVGLGDAIRTGLNLALFVAMVDSQDFSPIDHNRMILAMLLLCSVLINLHNGCVLHQLRGTIF